jgi:beta-lactamase class A
MGRRPTSIPKMAVVLALCGALIAAWAVFEHRRADAAGSAGSARSAGSAGSARSAGADATPRSGPAASSAAPTASPSPSIVDVSPAGEAAPSPDPVAVVRDELATALAGQGGNVGIEVLDRVTGRSVGYQESLAVQTASIVKVDILATLLWQDQKAGRQPTANQRDLAEDMITESDNDAASALWDAIGGASGLATANRAFGLTGTTPGPDGYWGATKTTSADQIRLLAMLADDSGPLSAGNRAYELNLMANVESDQRWGVPAAAGSQTTAVYVKNGWLSSPSDNDLWVVNSIGRIVEPGHDWLVAVLTNHESDEDPAITLIQNTASTVLNGLR